MVARMAKKKPGRPKEPDSKRQTGVDRHADPRKAFHCSQELLDALERYRDATKPPPSEAGCLRTALEEFLEKRGFWPPKAASADEK